jgi:glycosyltransferase involved in cell wall biosynthesis
MNKSKILILGPIFNTPAGPSGQGGALYKRLKSSGEAVNKVSHYRNKVLRMIHSVTVALQFWKYDIIHLQSFGLLAFVMEDVVSKISSITGKPIIFTLRGGAFFEFYERHPKWVRRVLSRATVITSPSQFLKEKFEHLGFQIEYIPNAIDLSRFQANRNPKKYALLWVRSFHDIYHPELAIQTVAVLKERYPRVHLTMIGPDQGKLEECKRMIRDLNLENQISILGYISNDQLSQYYNSHEVYLNTTRYESFGVALVEAASCGIPTVSTSVGEIPLIWKNGENVILSERNEQSFANSVVELFEDEGLYHRISTGAIANAKKYDWDNVLPQWTALYNRLLSRKKKCVE